MGISYGIHAMPLHGVCMNLFFLNFLHLLTALLLFWCIKKMLAASVVHAFIMCMKMKQLGFERDMLKMFCIGQKQAFHLGFLMVIRGYEF